MERIIRGVVGIWMVALFAGLVRAEEGLILVTVGGGGHRMSSVDGENFGNHQQWGPCAHDANDLLHATYGKGLFVAVGGWSKPRVVVSPDGKSWEEIDPKMFEGAPGGTFRVLFVEDHFYLMSQMGAMMRSPDGRKWEKIGVVPLARKPKMQRVRDLAFGNGVFVGVGDYGAVSVSKDMGKTWTVSTAKHHGEERTWPGVEFGDGRFVLTGLDGYTATSEDGVKWENETTHDGAYRKIDHLSWTGKEFFAQGKPVKKGPPHHLISKDGISWEIRPVGWKGYPSQVWRFDDTYYGVTDDFFKGNTAIYRSPDGKTWEQLKNEKGYSARWMTANR